MELRVIPPRKKAPNKYDREVTFVIPAKVIEIQRNDQIGSVIPIIIERLDFQTGELIKSHAITFQGSVEIFDGLDLKPPFYSDCVVYKEHGKIKFKVIGKYNPGFEELFYSVADNILDNDKRQIINVFKSNYKELNDWSND